jgi:predicted dehydrogenase
MTVRFGIAGTGFWAREVHVPGLRRTPGAQPVAIWGRNTAEAQAIATRHGLQTCATFDAMLNAVDAVSFALPPSVQGRLALQAAGAGKHLLLEKPVATSSASSAAIAAEVAARRLCTVVFFMRRFVPDVEAAVSRAGRSEWTCATVRVHSSALAADSPYVNSVWRREPGAALWDIGPHVLSILIPVLGRVQEVTTEQAEEPFCSFATSHARGSSASVALTLHALRENALNEYRFASSSGELVLPDPPLDRPGVYSIAAGELVANIVDGLPHHRCDVAFGAEVVHVLEALEHSRSSGKRVALAP